MKSERDWRIIPVLLTALSPARASDSFVYDLPSVFHPASPSPSPLPSSSTSSTALFPRAQGRAPLPSPRSVLRRTRARSAPSSLNFISSPSYGPPRVLSRAVFFLSVSPATPLTAHTRARNSRAFVRPLSLFLSFELAQTSTETRLAISGGYRFLTAHFAVKCGTRLRKRLRFKAVGTESIRA